MLDIDRLFFFSFEILIIFVIDTIATVVINDTINIVTNNSIKVNPFLSLFSIASPSNFYYNHYNIL